MNDLKEMIKVQCSNGNWNYDPYMHGMANGMICAMALITGKEPEYLEAPKVWLKDLPDISKPTSSLNVQKQKRQTNEDDNTPNP